MFKNVFRDYNIYRCHCPGLGSHPFFLNSLGYLGRKLFRLQISAMLQSSSVFVGTLAENGRHQTQGVQGV